MSVHHYNDGPRGEVIATLTACADCYHFTAGDIAMYGRRRMVVVDVDLHVGTVTMRPETWWEALLWWMLAPVRWVRSMRRRR